MTAYSLLVRSQEEKGNGGGKRRFGLDEDKILGNSNHGIAESTLIPTSHILARDRE